MRRSQQQGLRHSRASLGGPLLPLWGLLYTVLSLFCSDLSFAFSLVPGGPPPVMPLFVKGRGSLFRGSYAYEGGPQGLSQLLQHSKQLPTAAATAAGIPGAPTPTAAAAAARSAAAAAAAAARRWASCSGVRARSAFQQPLGVNRQQQQQQLLLQQHHRRYVTTATAAAHPPGVVAESSSTGSTASSSSSNSSSSSSSRRSSSNSMVQVTVGRSHEFAVYIHLPFCLRRCYFCAFPIALLPASSSAAAAAAAAAYLPLLQQEMAAEFEAFLLPHKCRVQQLQQQLQQKKQQRQQLAEQQQQQQHLSLCDVEEALLPALLPVVSLNFSGSSIPVSSTAVAATTAATTAATAAAAAGAAAETPSRRLLRSVYFGGGTPSLMPPEMLRQLLQQIEGFETDLQQLLQQQQQLHDALQQQQGQHQKQQQQQQGQQKQQQGEQQLLQQREQPEVSIEIYPGWTAHASAVYTPGDPSFGCFCCHCFALIAATPGVPRICCHCLRCAAIAVRHLLLFPSIRCCCLWCCCSRYSG